MADILTEQQYGEGAFRAAGKFIVHGGEAPHLFAGSIYPLDEKPLEGADGNHQMWECEVIIIPRRKFKDEGTFRGYRIDQVLTSQFGNREMWQPPYWEKKD